MKNTSSNSWMNFPPAANKIKYEPRVHSTTTFTAKKKTPPSLEAFKY